MVSTTGGPVWLTGIPHLVCILYTAGGCCTVSQEIVCKLEGVVVTGRGLQPRLGTEPTAARTTNSTRIDTANSKQVSALPTPNKGLHCQLHQDLRYQLQTRICAANSKQGSALPTPNKALHCQLHQDLRYKLQTRICAANSKQVSALTTQNKDLRCQLQKSGHCKLNTWLVTPNRTSLCAANFAMPGAANSPQDFALPTPPEMCSADQVFTSTSPPTMASRAPL